MVPLLYFQFFVFLIAAILAFVIPGVNLLRPLRRPCFETIVLGTTVGIALWAIQGYIFGFLHVRWLSYIYLIVNFLIFAVIFRKQFKLNKLKLFNRIDLLSTLIVIVGSILNLSAVWFMGTQTSSGLYFCCRGVPDAIYHLSLTNELIKNFPPYEPGMSGVLVKNYHYLSNLVAADIARIFNLDFIRVQFQYLNLLIALLLGCSAFVLGRILKQTKAFCRWLAIFMYGSGDILYVLLFLRGLGVNFNVTIFDDATKLLAGPPRAFSILIIFTAICLFCLWIKKRNLYTGILMAVVMGTLVGFKVYTGLFALTGLGIIGIYYLLKKDIRMIIPPLLALLIFLAYYIPNNSSAGFIYFNGLWRFENFMQHSDLAISKLDYLRIQKASEHRYLEVAIYEIVFIIIYFVFLFGTINLGFFQNKKSLKLLPKELHIFLISAILVSVVVGSFFYQSTGGANTVQFLLTVFIVASIYAALAISYWTSKLPFKTSLLVIAIVFVLTTSRSFYEVVGNFSSIYSKKGFLIENQQLEAFNFLRYRTPENSKIAVEPWMAEDEPFMYVTFLTNRQLFLSGAGVLRDHGQDTKSREVAEKTIFTSSNNVEVEDLLKKNQIEYIYLPKNYSFKSENRPYLRKVFENEAAIIFEVI